MILSEENKKDSESLFCYFMPRWCRHRKKVNNMLKGSQKCLTVLLTIVSIVTIINVLIMFWFPILIPLSSFTVLRNMFIGLIEKKYYLIIVSALICLLLFVSGISVRRQRILLPVMSLMYLIYDLIRVFILLIDGLGDGHWSVYIIQTIVSIVLIVLLGAYCWNSCRGTSHNCCSNNAGKRNRN